MARFKFCILSCVMILAAIWCQLVWQGHCGRALSLRAKSVTWTETQRTEARAEAATILHQGRLYPSIGIGLAATGLILWIVALVRREPAWTTLPFALLVGYVFSLLLIV